MRSFILLAALVCANGAADTLPVRRARPAAFMIMPTPRGGCRLRGDLNSAPPSCVCKATTVAGILFTLIHALAALPPRSFPMYAHANTHHTQTPPLPHPTLISATHPKLTSTGPLFLLRTPPFHSHTPLPLQDIPKQGMLSLFRKYGISDEKVQAIMSGSGDKVEEAIVSVFGDVSDKIGQERKALLDQHRVTDRAVEAEFQEEQDRADSKVKAVMAKLHASTGAIDANVTANIVR